MSEKIFTTCTMPFDVPVQCPGCEGFIGWCGRAWCCENPACELYGKKYYEPRVTVMLAPFEEKEK